MFLVDPLREFNFFREKKMPFQIKGKWSIYFANKGPSSQGYGFSSGHVWMWDLDCEESWAPKNWCFWTVVLEKTLRSPLDCREIQPGHPKGHQPWIFIGRTDGWSWNSNTLATWCEELTHWQKSWCWERLKPGGDGDDRGWDGWVAWPTVLDRHEFEQALGVGDGQGSLVCCSPWGCKEPDMTEWQLNWREHFMEWWAWWGTEMARI